jgi:hypothetical protein
MRHDTKERSNFLELRFGEVRILGILRSSLDMRLDSESGIMLVVEKDDPLAEAGRKGG